MHSLLATLKNLHARRLAAATAVGAMSVLPAAAQPVAPASAAAPASAPWPAASAAPAAPATVTESVDPARAAAIVKAARAIGDRNTRVAAAGGAPPVAGLVRGKTDDGSAFLSGGVTVDDRRTMRAERASYSLWIATVAKRSGAYLGDVRLAVTRAGEKAPVLARTMDGPWLLAALPAGRYEIVATLPGEAAAKDQTIKVTVALAKSGLRQAVLRFDSPAEVSPDGSDPFKGNPFGADPAASAPKKK